MYEELDEAILRYLRKVGRGMDLWLVYDAVSMVIRFGLHIGPSFGYELVRRRLYALRKKGLISYLPGQGWVAVQKEGA